MIGEISSCVPVEAALRQHQAAEDEARIRQVEHERRVADVLDRFECDSYVLGEAFREQGWNITQEVLDILGDFENDKLARIRKLVRDDTLKLAEKEIGNV